MKRAFSFLAVLMLGTAIASCGYDTPSSPTTDSTVTFTARLLPANEVPPITNDDASGSADATITIKLTKDQYGTTTAASMDASVTAAGFPSGTAVTNAHIHAGADGTNGGVFVSIGLADGEVMFASGSGSFTKSGIALTADQADTILANPAGFYFNIHTARNPNGAARGQLSRVR